MGGLGGGAGNTVVCFLRQPHLGGMALRKNHQRVEELPPCLPLTTAAPSLSPPCVNEH